MKLTYKTIGWLIVLAVGLVFVGLYVWTSDVQRTSDVVNTPSESLPILSPTESEEQNRGSSISQPNQKSDLEEIGTIPTPGLQDPTSIVGRLAPAKCNLTGEIVFIEPNIYESGKAFIEYENIDHEARLITWTVTPEYNFSIGPNIFASMAIPAGKVGLSASLDDVLPTQKEYTVKAKVNYGQLIDRDIKLFETECTGETKIKLVY